MNRSFLCSFRKLFHCSLCHTHKNRLPQARRYNFPFCCMVTEFHQGKLKMYTNSIDFITWRYGGHIEGFHMTSRRPYWCPRQVPWEMNSFVMQTLSFVRINLHRCWPRDENTDYRRILVYSFCLISIGLSLSDEANKMKFLNIERAQKFQSENLSPIYQIVSEKFSLKNPKIYKECMSLVTFCHPVILQRLQTA